MEAASAYLMDGAVVDENHIQVDTMYPTHHRFYASLRYLGMSHRQARTYLLTQGYRRGQIKILCLRLQPSILGVISAALSKGKGRIEGAKEFALIPALRLVGS